MRTALTLQAPRLLACAVLVLFYFSARLPRLNEQEGRQLASEFRFSRLPLPTVGPPADRSIRTVHPDFQHFAAWISSLGAAVALADLDHDGKPNDVCWVDPRTDQVIVAPLPAGEFRYEPQTLQARPLPYEPATMAPMGCVPADLNEDGRTDLLVYYWGRTPILFLSRGSLSGSRPFVPVELAQTGERWYSNAAVVSDLDGDGRLDVVIGNYFPDGARVLDGQAPRGTEQMQDSMSRACNGGKNRILRRIEPDLSEDRFIPAFQMQPEVLQESRARNWTLAAGAADLDGDLLPEVYFANDFGPDQLLHNRSSAGRIKLVTVEGEKGFFDPSSKVLGKDSFKGMGVDFADLNGDGRLDIYVSNIAAAYALEESHFVFLSRGPVELFLEGVAPYYDGSEALGLARSDWSWEARLGDFNNDGVPEAVQATGFLKGNIDRWPELHELAMGNDQLVSNSGSWPRFQAGDDLSGSAATGFFVRAQDGRYYDLAAQVGLSQPHVSRGIATADVDHDGDLDFVLANQWEDSFLYLNEYSGRGSFLGLRLLFPPSGSQAAPAAGRSGRFAIGAQVRVFSPDGSQRVAQVDGCSGHSGCRSPEVHLGLGEVAADTQLEVQILWRDSTGQARSGTLSLPPGWHTVRLGRTAERGQS